MQAFSVNVMNPHICWPLKAPWALARRGSTNNLLLLSLSCKSPEKDIVHSLAGEKETSCM